jgi:hypothetical protein
MENFDREGSSRVLTIRGSFDNASEWDRQASPDQELNRDEVRSSEHVHMPADELLPSRRWAPFWRRRDVVAVQDIADALIRFTQTLPCRRE